MVTEIMARIGILTVGFLIYNALYNYSDYRLMNSKWDSRKNKFVYVKKQKR